MKERLLDALKNCDADYAEVRFEESDGSGFSYRGKELEQASTGCSCGGLVRACKNGGWSTSSFDSLDDLPEKVHQACRNAALVGHEKTCLAEAELPDDQVFTATLKRDFRGVSMEEKVKQLTAYNDILLHSTEGVESSAIRYTDTFRKVYFASTRGSYFMEERPRVTLFLQAFAKDGSRIQQAFESLSSATDYDVVLNHEQMAADVARRAVDLLNAPKCPGGRQTVILDPAFAGVFAHEAFGHLSEADFLYENPKMRDLMKIGRQMGAPELNIIDDGSLGSLIGTHAVDDEGTPTRRTELIRDGVLAGHLHSLETAGKMGEAPTGNARAISAGYPPIVRMTNTYIDAGPLSKEDLFAGVDDGIYAVSAFGGQTMMEMFTFSAAYGYRIRNGQICELLRDIVVTGNVFETLYSIDGIANDLCIHETAGGCGKNGQFPLPVTHGSPHIRIRNVVVGGEA